MSLNSWGAIKFKWVEGRTYIRTHSTNRGNQKELMMMLFNVETIRNNQLIGREIISNRSININYKSDQAQEFEPVNNKRRMWVIKFLFEGFENGNGDVIRFTVWDPEHYNDTGWST